MVDIDETCVNLCKQFLKSHHQNSFSDERHNLVINDARAVMESSEDGSYDVIILDLADPMDGGPCYQLVSC